MKRFFKHAVRLFPFWYILLLWMIELIQFYTNTKYSTLGVHPRHWDEWFTMFTGAFIHSGFEHLIHNTYPLAVCGLFIYFLFERYSNLVFLMTFVLTGLFIFLFARSSTYHVGASGVAYSWAFLLAASGFFRNDRLSLGLGLVVAFLYGSMIWGIFPIEQGVSWDGHLYGGLSGILVAFLFRNINKQTEEDDQADAEEDSYQFDDYEYGDYEYLKRKKREEW